MTTRALYTFIDEDGEYRVYKQQDDYSKWAANYIKNTVLYVQSHWRRPRFESCGFAAAFISANKTEGGSIFHTTKSYDDYGDLTHRYEIEHDDDQLMITEYLKTSIGWKITYEGPFQQFENTNTRNHQNVYH